MGTSPVTPHAWDNGELPESILHTEDMKMRCTLYKEWPLWACIVTRLKVSVRLHYRWCPWILKAHHLTCLLRILKALTSCSFRCIFVASRLNPHHYCQVTLRPSHATSDLISLRYLRGLSANRYNSSSWQRPWNTATRQRTEFLTYITEILSNHDWIIDPTNSKHGYYFTVLYLWPLLELVD